MKTKYTVDYFIEKFEAIPNERWITDSFVKRSPVTGEVVGYCALGHCRADKCLPLPAEADALCNLFEDTLNLYVANVNDGARNGVGTCGLELGSTPKERILNALYLIKALPAHELASLTRGLI